MSETFDARVSTRHVEEEELALYVVDGLDPSRREAVEAHVLSCEECSEGLAREARAEAALEQVARLADERVGSRTAPLVAVMSVANAAIVSSLAHAGSARRGAHERSRWAGGVAGALAAAAALVLAFASATAPRPESAGMSQRVSTLHDAAGDMSGAFGTEVVMVDALDGG